ncbi:hypothetical protein L9F63_018255, partial [Diploptera punctata]
EHLGGRVNCSLTTNASCVVLPRRRVAGVTDYDHRELNICSSSSLVSPVARNLKQKAAKKHNMYKYEDILTVLLPHLSERDSLTNVPPPGNGEANVSATIRNMMAEALQDFGYTVYEEVDGVATNANPTIRFETHSCKPELHTDEKPEQNLVDDTSQLQLRLSAFSTPKKQIEIPAKSQVLSLYTVNMQEVASDVPCAKRLRTFSSNGLLHKFMSTDVLSNPVRCYKTSVVDAASTRARLDSPQGAGSARRLSVARRLLIHQLQT